MSCFACFSNKRVSPDDLYDAPRPVRNVSRAEKASVTHVEKTTVSEKDIEKREITVTEKEVDLLVSEEEYDSEDEKYEAVSADVEKTIEMSSSHYKRGVLPSRKSKAQRITVHNTGREYRIQEENEETIAKIADPTMRSKAQEAERNRHRKWEMDRYGC